MRSYFLRDSELVKTELDRVNEIAFGMLHDTTDPNALPLQDNPNLRSVLREANWIVKSIHFKHARDTPKGQ